VTNMKWLKWRTVLHIGHLRLICREALAQIAVSIHRFNSSMPYLPPHRQAIHPPSNLLETTLAPEIDGTRPKNGIRSLRVSGHLNWNLPPRCNFLFLLDGSHRNLHNVTTETQIWSGEVVGEPYFTRSVPLCWSLCGLRFILHADASE
jgi:hypothetical protein